MKSILQEHFSKLGQFLDTGSLAWSISGHLEYWSFTELEKMIRFLRWQDTDIKCWLELKPLSSSRSLILSGQEEAAQHSPAMLGKPSAVLSFSANTPPSEPHIPTLANSPLPPSLLLLPSSLDVILPYHCVQWTESQCPHLSREQGFHPGETELQCVLWGMCSARCARLEEDLAQVTRQEMKLIPLGIQGGLSALADVSEKERHELVHSLQHDTI